MSALLELRGLTAAYGRVQVLHGIDFDVDEGEIVTILGANGAGKTTLLRSISRVVDTTGELRFDGESLVGHSTDGAARAGIGHVPEGRGTFVDLTVEENLRLGLLSRPKRLRSDGPADLARMYELFGILDERRTQRAGSLSGGQQQMLAIARALLGRPRLLLVDELSLGLAPMVTAEILERLRELREPWGLTVILAEQNVRAALAFADRAYVLESGAVLKSGTAAELAADDTVAKAYLGA